MKCDNKCDPIALVMTTEMKAFCWECTECGWHKRVTRTSYEVTVKRPKEDKE